MSPEITGRSRPFLGSGGVIHLIDPAGQCLTCGNCLHHPRGAARAREARAYVRSKLYEHDRVFCGILNEAYRILAAERAVTTVP